MDAPLSPPPPPLLPAHEVLDAEHLRLLGIFHFVVGGLTILFSCIFIIYIVIGAAALANPQSFAPAPPGDRAQFAPPPTPGPPPDQEPAPPEHHPVARGPHSGGPPPAWFGLIFMGIGAVFVLVGWTAGGLLLLSGFFLLRRRHRVFSMVIAGISCLQVPFGTILGVLTLVVLQRPTVHALYQRSLVPAVR